MRNTEIIWLTGMSGAGKSTLTEYVAEKLVAKGVDVLILDGDKVRESYDVTLGYGRSDVEKNNLNVAKICIEEKQKYDLIIVPIISPIDKVRKRVRALLSPRFSLVYLSVPLEVLRERDTKGLYKLADLGEINNLIGYSKGNPYDTPLDADFQINVSGKYTIEQSTEYLYNFIIKKL